MNFSHESVGIWKYDRTQGITVQFKPNTPARPIRRKVRCKAELVIAWKLNMVKLDPLTRCGIYDLPGSWYRFRA